MAGPTTDRLTARALTLALEGVATCDAATVLLRLAGDNRRAVELALARVRRGLVSRPSPVGDRAAAALLRVLDHLDGATTTVASTPELAV